MNEILTENKRGNNQKRRVMVLVMAMSLLCVLAGASGARAQNIQVHSVGLISQYQAAYTMDDEKITMSRFSLMPSVKLRLPNSWRLNAKARLEWAGADVGLGELDTFSDQSRPIHVLKGGRMEFDELALEHRAPGVVVGIGKQVIGWGVLDGIQVADQFNPIRLRDFVFTDTHPERISLWSGRVRVSQNDWAYDLALALDPSGDQIAESGSLFNLRASRFLAGQQSAAGSAHFPVSFNVPENALSQMRGGVRVSRRLGQARISALAISGPSTSPVFVLETKGGQPVGIGLEYPTHEVVGLTTLVPDGNVVWRAEASYDWRYPINVDGESSFQIERVKRLMAGIGFDWSAPDEVFVSGQVVAEKINGNQRRLFRRDLEVFGTLSARKALMNDTLKLEVEYLGTLRNLDGTVRPSAHYRASDVITLSGGADFIFGGAEEVFGQFSDEDRIWARITIAH